MVALSPIYGIDRLYSVIYYLLDSHSNLLDFQKDIPLLVVFAEIFSPDRYTLCDAGLIAPYKIIVIRYSLSCSFVHPYENRWAIIDVLPSKQ